MDLFEILFYIVLAMLVISNLAHGLLHDELRSICSDLIDEKSESSKRLHELEIKEIINSFFYDCMKKKMSKKPMYSIDEINTLIEDLDEFEAKKFGIYSTTTCIITNTMMQ